MNYRLFFTGFIQVFFVAVNTYFISKSLYLGVLICGFSISIIWSWNVKKVVFGTFVERLIYSTGAAFGSLAGALISKLIAG